MLSTKNQLKGPQVEKNDIHLNREIILSEGIPMLHYFADLDRVTSQVLVEMRADASTGEATLYSIHS